MDTTPKLSDQYSQRQFPNLFLFVSRDSPPNPPFPHKGNNGITSKFKFWEKRHRPKRLPELRWCHPVEYSGIFPIPAVRWNSDRMGWEAGEENFPVKNSPQSPKSTREGKRLEQRQLQGISWSCYTQGVPKRFFGIKCRVWGYFGFSKTQEVPPNTCSPPPPAIEVCKTAILYGTSLTKVSEGENHHLLLRIFPRTFQLPQKGFHSPPPWAPYVFHENSSDLYSEHAEVIK